MEETNTNPEQEMPAVQPVPEKDVHELFNEQVQIWFANKGDLTHRIYYDELTPDSVVLDLGGYEGGWASNIYSKYNCYIEVFEPIKEYYEYIKTRFSKNNKIEAYNFAFSNSDRDEICCISNDASSVYMDFKNADRLEIVKLKNFNTYMDAIDHVDLIKINIEGSEFDLLECISDENIKKLKNIQVQFHKFVPNCVERRNAIRSRLSKTHTCTYNYDFVWENWKINQ